MEAETKSPITEVSTSVKNDFRMAMRRHAASVCLVTVSGDNALNGMTITAATSFSMDPPAVLICINSSASIAPCLGLGQSFGLTLLAEDQEEIATAFARSPSGPGRFAHGDWALDASSPCLSGAASNLKCSVVETVAYGSHRAIIGRVDEVQLGTEVLGLVYRDGRYDKVSHSL